MADKFFLRLPSLHAVSGRHGPDCARYLSPGIVMEENAPVWAPGSYIFSPQEAAGILDAMRNSDVAELERMRLLLALHHPGAESETRSELDDIARFVLADAAAGPCAKVRLALEQAQKILLWIWLQEELFTDIKGISQACAAREALLLGQFGENPCAAPENPGLMFEPDRSILPSWQICVANAALFIPHDMPVLVEGDMRACMLENFAFTPAAEMPEAWLASLAGGLLFTRAPLWKVLGHSRPDTVLCGPEWESLDGCYNHDRIWLAEAAEKMDATRDNG